MKQLDTPGFIISFRGDMSVGEWQKTTHRQTVNDDKHRRMIEDKNTGEWSKPINDHLVCSKLYRIKLIQIPRQFRNYRRFLKTDGLFELWKDFQFFRDSETLLGRTQAILFRPIDVEKSGIHPWDKLFDSVDPILLGAKISCKTNQDTPRRQITETNFFDS